MKPTGTRELDYGLRTMIQLAGATTRLRAADIAQATNIPPGTLRHVLDGLRRAKLVSARPSRQGGFSLARAPSQITVLDVVEVFEGPLVVSECPFGMGPCFQAEQCSLHETWESAWQAMCGQLACRTIADLVARDLSSATASPRPKRRLASTARQGPAHASAARSRRHPPPGGVRSL